MPSDLTLIPPLLGGFWFVLRCQLLYLVSLQFGQGIVILLSAFFGLVFALIARTATWLLHLTAWGQLWEQGNSRAWHFPFSGTSIGAFVLAILLAEISRATMQQSRVNSWVIRNYAGDLIAHIHRAMMDLAPVSLTLKSRKVYVGFVQGVPSLDPAKAYIRLLPVLSGYRDSDKLIYCFTTDYAAAIDEVEDPRSLIKVIPLSEIQSAGLFDVGLYERHFVPPSLRV